MEKPVSGRWDRGWWRRCPKPWCHRSVFGVFARKQPVLRDFLFPAFTGFLLPKLGFCPKTGLCVSRPGKGDLSRTGKILGRETPVWAAQEAGGFGAQQALGWVGVPY